MPRKIMCIIIISVLLLTSTTALSAFEKVTTLSNEIVVPDDYPTIQEAINHANRDDIIRVRPGIYHENIVVNVYHLQIIGSGIDITTIDGDGKDNVVSINVPGTYSSVTISGFTIRNSGAGNAGIRIYANDGATIIENKFTDNGYGIFIESQESDGNEIYHNNFVNNGQNAYDKPSTSIWFNPDLKEGNHWDDYIGTDNDGDGIGDTGYGIPPIPDHAVDKYPLIEPYSPNNPPNKPTCRYDKSSDELVVSTTDIDGDQVKFGVSWNNDETVNKWTTGYYQSGQEVRISCEGNEGTIGVVAEDEHGAQSDWVGIKSKQVSAKPILLRLLDIFPNALLILQRLLNLRTL